MPGRGPPQVPVSHVRCTTNLAAPIRSAGASPRYLEPPSYRLPRPHPHPQAVPQPPTEPPMRALAVPKALARNRVLSPFVSPPTAIAPSLREIAKKRPALNSTSTQNPHGLDWRRSQDGLLTPRAPFWPGLGLVWPACDAADRHHPCFFHVSSPAPLPSCPPSK